ncbi:hypothetical protein BYT27DRAFT_7301104 [Phlegmacium glaucopus]|nr:hypothetical protein BYT27DRAFT_7301104 [Phlegmacium glaucopus]
MLYFTIFCYNSLWQKLKFADGCHRVPKQKFISECICGNPVPAEEMEKKGCAINCKQAGCETIWYHLECVGLEHRIPGWVCESCKSSGGKGQGGK